MTVQRKDDQRKPRAADAHVGLGVDSVTLRFDLKDLPNIIASKPHNLQGWWATGGERGGWKATPLSRLGAGITVRECLPGSGGKLASGEMILYFSVAELLTRAEGKKGNLGKCNPALLRDVLFTVVSDLEDVFGVQGLTKVCRVDEVDIICDVVVDDVPGAIACLKGRTARILKRAKREGWSHETEDGPGSVYIPRRAPKHGNLRTAEGTALYDKARQLKRDDLQGLLRLECCHGTGLKFGCSTPTINEICKADLWRKILSERLLELGLPKDAKVVMPPSPHAACDALIAAGVPPPAAAMYALMSTGSVPSMPKRTARYYRQKVESMTALRFSADRVDSCFVQKLWALIEGEDLEDPHDSPRYDDDVSRAFGLRPSARRYDVGDLNTALAKADAAIHGDDHRPSHGTDTPIASPAEQGQGQGPVSPQGHVDDPLRGNDILLQEENDDDCDDCAPLRATARPSGPLGITMEGEGEGEGTVTSVKEGAEMRKQQRRPVQVPKGGQMGGEREGHREVQMTMGLTAQGGTPDRFSLALARLERGELPPLELPSFGPEDHDDDTTTVHTARADPPPVMPHEKKIPRKEAAREAELERRLGEICNWGDLDDDDDDVEPEPPRIAVPPDAGLERLMDRPPPKSKPSKSKPKPSKSKPDPHTAELERELDARLAAICPELLEDTP